MTIIGHKKIISLLDRSIARNNVAQSYVFSGPESLGKFTVALNFAEKLTGDGGQLNSDLIILEPEVEEKKGIKKRKQIKIEKIRELQHWLGLSSSGAKMRVAIINDAGWLNLSAQSALLKVLEEPKENSIIILITEDERKLLPTILSRCQKIRFGLVADAELTESLPGNVENSSEIIFWSLGRPGLLLELIKNKEELGLRRESSQELEFLLEKNVAEKFSLAESLCKDNTLLARKFDFWLVILREALSKNALKTKIASAKALELIERINENSKLIQGTNVNCRLLMENLFLYF